MFAAKIVIYHINNTYTVFLINYCYHHWGKNAFPSNIRTFLSDRKLLNGIVINSKNNILKM